MSLILYNREVIENISSIYQPMRTCCIYMLDFPLGFSRCTSIVAQLESLSRCFTNLLNFESVFSR